MNTILKRIRQSLSIRLSLWILGFVVVIFIITIGFLYQRTRESVRQTAIEQATQILNNNLQNLVGILNEIEIATNNTDWLVMQNLQPDSLLALSRHILEVNPNLYGCSIAFIPNFFEDQGKYFSAYSSNDNGHIETENEGNEDYDRRVVVDADPVKSLQDEHQEQCDYRAVDQGYQQRAEESDH